MEKNSLEMAVMRLGTKEEDFLSHLEDRSDAYNLIMGAFSDFDKIICRNNKLIEREFMVLLIRELRGIREALERL